MNYMSDQLNDMENWVKRWSCQGHAVLGAWRERALCEFESIERRERKEGGGEDDPCVENVPDEVRAEYRAVSALISQGKFDMYDVLAGTVDSGDIRVVRRWMECRLTSLRSVWMDMESRAGEGGG